MVVSYELSLTKKKASECSLNSNLMSKGTPVRAVRPKSQFFTAAALIFSSSHTVTLIKIEIETVHTRLELRPSDI
jgi:hypothetical protein